ncbi:MAG: class I SAM-dependent methyltransferase [Actinobacteria bacterium]|nr:class I SAM-dependent methyltransferase [Actinomycetota bacterium]
MPVETSTFDAVICWFTSFGYFDDHGNRAVLSEFARVLRPGGTLIIETLHRDGFLRSLKSSPHEVSRGDDKMTDIATFDVRSGGLETERTVRRGDQVRRSQFSVRLPTLPEFDDWLTGAGFGERAYSDRLGLPLTDDSLRLVVTAKK